MMLTTSKSIPRRILAPATRPYAVKECYLASVRLKRDKGKRLHVRLNMRRFRSWTVWSRTYGSSGIGRSTLQRGLILCPLSKVAAVVPSIKVGLARSHPDSAQTLLSIHKRKHSCLHIDSTSYPCDHERTYYFFCLNHINKATGSPLLTHA
jgi:hypothetical protein